MNEKKVREAIYCMKASIGETMCEECVNYYGCDHTKMDDMMRTAIEALEKQLPKKVENWNGQASCPRCKRLFGNMEDVKMFRDWDSDCCNHCGQRLDWSE